MMAWIGKWLVGVGLVHSTFGLVFMGDVLASLWSDGLFNTVNGQPVREAVFWFLCTGTLLLIAGVLVDQVERRRLALPTFVTWAFTVMTVIGVVVMPISGIWLLLPPVFGMLLRWSRRVPPSQTLESHGG